MHTPETNEREQAIYAALDAAHKQGPPPERSSSPDANLITIAYNTADLCWSIRALKVSAEYEQVAACARANISEAANNILRLCLTELDDMHKGVNRAGVTIVSDCADFCLHEDYPLNQLDLNIDTDERIKHLLEALGEAATYWLHTDDATPTDIEYREGTIAMVAYQAACTIIANGHGLIYPPRRNTP